MLLLLLACTGAPPGDSGVGVVETCVDATQYSAPGVLGTDLAGLRYCWSDDPYGPRWDRTEAPACTSDEEAFLQECAESEPDAPCATDADCGGGQCTYDGWSSCECVPTCTTSEDCAAGESCLCAAAYETPGGELNSPQGWSQCRPAECTSSADCGGEPCGLSLDICQYPLGFYCHGADDTCLYDSDCATNERCLYDTDASVWACSEGADCE